MNGVNFSEASQFLGRPNGMRNKECNALPVAKGTWVAPTGNAFPVVVSCFEPTPKERKAIAEGENIYLHVIGLSMPPVLLSTQVEATINTTN